MPQIATLIINNFNAALLIKLFDNSVEFITENFE